MLFSVWILNVCMARYSTVALLEVFHERDQRLDPGFGHRVVEARAHAADHAVTFEVREARGLRLLEERFVELRIRERERHVHPRTRRFLDGILVEIRAIDRGVELRRLALVDLRDRRDAA